MIVVRNETSWIVIFCHSQMSRIVKFCFFVRNGPYPLPAEKNFWEPATRATVLASSSNLDHRIRTTFLCRRSFKVLARSARMKRLIPKQTKKSQMYAYIFYQESVEALWYLYTQYNYLINLIPTPFSSSLPPTAHCCTASIYCSCPELLWRFVVYCRQVTLLFAKTSTYDLPVYSSTWVPLKPLLFYSVSFLWYNESCRTVRALWFQNLVIIKFDLRTGVLFFCPKMPQNSQISPYLRPTLNYTVTPREQQGNDCPALQ